MRQAAHCEIRIEPDRAEHVAHPALPLGPVGDTGDDQRLGHDVADAPARIERGDRILKNELQAPPQQAQRLAAHVREIPAFEQDAADFAGFSKTKLKMPMLVLTGEKASGEFLIAQGRLVAENVEGVIIRGSGHWTQQEKPAEASAAILDWLERRFPV